MITADTVARTCERIGNLPETQAPALIEELISEQPCAMVYLQIATEDPDFTTFEREIVFYIGIVLIETMRNCPGGLRRVSEATLERVDAENEALFEKLASTPEAKWASTLLPIIGGYPEPEVLRYLIEALMEEPEAPEEERLSPDGSGLAFIYLKSLLDALVASRQVGTPRHEPS